MRLGLVAAILLLAVALPIVIPGLNSARHAKESQDRTAQHALLMALEMARMCLPPDPRLRDCTGPGRPSVVSDHGPYFTDGSSSSGSWEAVSEEIQGERSPVVGLAIYSDSGTCFYLFDDRRWGTRYGSAPSDGTDCFGKDAMNVSGAGTGW